MAILGGKILQKKKYKLVINTAVHPIPMVAIFYDIVHIAINLIYVELQ